MLTLVFVATIGSALASSAVRGFTVLQILAIWRFILGIGMGGDYPQSATITAERAGKDKRGKMVAAVFAMQGFGILIGSFLVLTLVAAFKGPILSDPLYLDYVWRIALGVPAIPSAILLYYRFTMPESEKYKQDQQLEADIKELRAAGKYIEPAQGSKLHSRDFGVWITHPTNATRLFATSYCWFALDVAWYFSY